MPVKLSVTPAADPGSQEQYTFTKERIIIGRDPSCDVVLPDVKRIVSKQHAAVEQGDAGFELVDLGSKNFTFLNGVRLQSNQPEPLQPGDAIRIGEFEIDFTLVEAEPTGVFDMDRTVFLVNPFDEPAAQLAAALRRLSSVYEEEIPGRREEALREALRDLSDEDVTEVRSAVVRAMGPAQVAGEVLPEKRTPAPATASRRAPGVSPLSDAPAVNRVDGPSVPAQPVVRADYDPGTAYERVFGALIHFVPKILGMPWRFRHEFIGQTIMHSPDAAALFEGSPEEVRRYLLDPSASDEELERRATLLAETGDEVAFHALAMVDGYRASVEQGMSRLIDEIDPIRIEEEIKRERSMMNLLPLVLEFKIVKRLREKMAEIRGEDWSVVERRVYRPAFIKAYLARMTSRRRPS